MIEKERILQMIGDRIYADPKMMAQDLEVPEEELREDVYKRQIQGSIHLLR